MLLRILCSMICIGIQFCKACFLRFGNIFVWSLFKSPIVLDWKYIHIYNVWYARINVFNKLQQAKIYQNIVYVNNICNFRNVRLFCNCSDLISNNYFRCSVIFKRKILRKNHNDIYNNIRLIIHFKSGSIP